ncbi:MAG: nickel pincer cofactor biosynthesis protein LarC [Bacillota bacterium]
MIIYFDCFSGISGDMCLGALLDAGLDIRQLEECLQSLRLEGYNLRVEKVVRSGISASSLHVEVNEPQPARHLKDIKEIINNSLLPATVKSQAVAVFQRLAEAEAHVHGTTPEHVHFHEVGAVDSLVDIIGSLVGLHLLGITKVMASPLPLGRGFVKCQHGVIPIPAPAVVELLKGIPVYQGETAAEMVTPTGAAILSSLAGYFGPMPEILIARTGYGAGKRSFPEPNLLRVILGDMVPSAQERFQGETDVVKVIDCNIDDMNPEFYQYTMEMLFLHGALDVFFTPVQMKKARPGTLITVVCPPDQLDQLVRILLGETTTLGVRIRDEYRMKSIRRILNVNTPYGAIRVKYSYTPWSEGEQGFNVAPEYEDCRETASSQNVPIKLIYDLAKSIALDELGNNYP